MIIQKDFYSRTKYEKKRWAYLRNARRWLSRERETTATSSESSESETLPQKRGSKCPRVDGTRWEKSARRLCTSISEYWNNSNAALPTFCTWPPLRTRRYSDDCQEHDILYGSGPPLPLTADREGRTGNDARVSYGGKSDGKEFLTFCRVSSRCESMSPASFGAEIPCDPRLPLFSPSYALCLYPRWHEKRL